MMKTLREIRVGDTVFVVWQNLNHTTDPPRTSFETITKIGRMYGYIRSGLAGLRFELATGLSNDGDNNTRCNGNGFDVYTTN